MAAKLPSLLLLLFLFTLQEMVMRPGEAALCSAPSRVFRGFCFSKNNCAAICEKEGFLFGECQELRCICRKNCNGGGGPPDQTPPSEGPPDQGPPGEGPPDQGPPGEGPPEHGESPTHQSPPKGGEGPGDQGPPGESDHGQGPPDGGDGPPEQGPPGESDPGQGPPDGGDQGSEAELCSAPSKDFRGICLSKSNCAAICEKEGFLFGECKRLKCVCRKNCKESGGPPDQGPPEGGEGHPDQGPPGESDPGPGHGLLSV